MAFLFDSTPEGAVERTLPALRAAQLAFATALLSGAEPVVVDLTPLDTSGSDPTAIAAQVAGDASYVAALAAPDLPEQGAIAEVLGEADVPLLTLSARDAVADPPPGTWLRFVAPVRTQAQALAVTAVSLKAAGKGMCVVSGPPDGSDYTRATVRSLSQRVDVTEAGGASAAAEAGCRVVVWTGGAEGGAELAAALAGSHGEVPTLVGGPSLLERAFLDGAGDAAEGTIAVCSCADVGTSLDLAAQRFVQDYQSQNGSPPGPYAVEAWDAAHVLIRGLVEGGRTRLGIVRWLASVRTVDGLGGVYTFSGGELVHPGSGIRRYRVTGGRWVLRAE